MPQQVRPAAELGDVPGLPRPARLAAGHEPSRRSDSRCGPRSRSTAPSRHSGQKPGFTKWDRKNYYYPDLPKNYQISQYDLPFSHDGWLEINVATDPKKDYAAKRVGIIRAHLEEDAGKNLHDETRQAAATRSSISTAPARRSWRSCRKPDMNTPEEAMAYLEEIRLLLREIGVSDCEMQEGTLRCDANVNIHVPQADGIRTHATPLVEIKNLNSFRGVGRAIAYEAKRQFEEYKKNPEGFRFGKVSKTTAGWDDARGVTVVQRHKEEAADYRYFPEPDLVPVVVSQELIEQVKAETGELPRRSGRGSQTQYGLSAYDAQVLTAKGRPTVAYFEAVAKALGDGKAAANRISDLVFPALAERKLEIEAFPLAAAKFAEFLKETGPLEQAGPRRSDEVHARQRGRCPRRDGQDRHQAADVRRSNACARRWSRRSPPTRRPSPTSRPARPPPRTWINGEVMKANKGAPNDVVQRLLDEELARI